MFSSLSLDVIDPCNRTGKISVPMQHVVATKGVSDFHNNPAKRDGKELSLCLLFQKGRCNAGSKCHQVHADPDFIAALREKALAVKNCCSCHGDVHSAGFAAMSEMTVTIYSGSDELQYSLSSFARTAFLDTVLRAKAAHGPRAPASKICRLHSQSRCKFGKDCKNVHLCPSATPIEATPVKKLAPPAAVDVSCDGLSAKSSQESTPREGMKPCGPLPLDSVMMLSSAQELSCISSTWGVASPQFDMSAIEDTIRCLCLDLTSAKEDPLAVCPPNRV
jgi:hypothetical protein